MILEIINFLDLNGLNTEGVYRLSSPQCELTKARQDIATDINAVQSLPVITLCNLLKMIIRELATPLINEDVVQDLLRANACITESEKCKRIKCVLQQLERTHLECLTDIILHLRRVANNAAVNKMTAENLAVVFAPSLMRTALSYSNQEPLAAINAANEDNKQKCQVIALLIKTL
ncbi:unnamed protein product [Lymnaea stagnalis]|uniref:Rho-GAP domain-containing protein n=1 Tax=Lymnaea stagnalis TaxID=6523 RepID=A0AAV2HEF1_LYMST